MMRVSLTGLFHQVGNGLDCPEARGYRYTMQELLNNLRELKERKAEGETVLDEFFGIYDVEES